MSTEPSRRSLRQLGLVAPNGLDCPEGGHHKILDPELQIAAGEGGGIVKCQACGEPVMLRSLLDLE